MAGRGVSGTSPSSPSRSCRSLESRLSHLSCDTYSIWPEEEFQGLPPRPRQGAVAPWNLVCHIFLVTPIAYGRKRSFRDFPLVPVKELSLPGISSVTSFL